MILSRQNLLLSKANTLQNTLYNSIGRQSSRALSTCLAGNHSQFALLNKHGNNNVYAVSSSLLLPSLRSSFSTSSEGQTNIVDLLTREYEEETDNKDSHSMPADLAELKRKLEGEENWKIMDSGALTQMYTTVESTSGAHLKVQVSFHCQDTVEAEDTEVYIPEDEMSPPIRFTATVTRAGQTMVLSCISENAAVRVQSVAISSRPVDELQKEGGVGLNEYQGPEFVELAEDLQEAFHVYAEEELGFREDFASFIAMYTDYKEQQQYIEFLKAAKKLLS